MKKVGFILLAALAAEAVAVNGFVVYAICDAAKHEKTGWTASEWKEDFNARVKIKLHEVLK